MIFIRFYSRNELERRLESRKNHFVNTKLLSSQLNSLEIPIFETNCYIIDANKDIGRVLDEILQILLKYQIP